VTLDREWLLGIAWAEREALGRTIQYTEPQDWDRESVIPPWRNRDIVAHLASTDVAAAGVLDGETPEEFVGFLQDRGAEGPISVDAFNEFAVRARAETPLRSVIREWGQAADRFLGKAGKVTDDEWSARKVNWMAGPIGVSYLVQSRVMEWWFHGDDIRAGTEQPPRVEHGPLYCINDLAVRTIPYALSLAGLSYPGRSVQVELDAVGGGSWHWGLAPRETPSPGKQPDAVITGRGIAFAMVAGRRVPAAWYLAEGQLLTSGDDALAETVLTHLRAFAA